MTLPIYLKSKKDTKNLYSLLMGTWLVTDEAESSIKLPFLGNFTHLQTKPVSSLLNLLPPTPHPPACSCLVSSHGPYHFLIQCIHHLFLFIGLFV